MEDLFKKVSDYQFFNFLLSGVLLVILVKQTTGIDLIYDNVIVQFFIFYFIGLVISRVGSLVVEPILKRLGVIRFAPYHDFVAAAKKDRKLDTLSQENNIYRTLIATFLVFAIIYASHKYVGNFIATHNTLITFLFIVLMVLVFALAYRKQTTYITKRIKDAKD